MEMLRRRVRVCKKHTKLKSGAVRKEWVLGGTPVVNSTTLTRSTDLTAAAVLWDCTAGSFNWQYDIDETIYILEGEVTIFVSELGNVNLGPGDTIYFPSGTTAVWTVPHYVRKVAFFRHPVPLIIGVPLIALTKLKRAFKSLMRSPAGVSRSLMFAAYSFSYLT